MADLFESGEASGEICAQTHIMNCPFRCISGVLMIRCSEDRAIQPSFPFRTLLLASTLISSQFVCGNPIVSHILTQYHLLLQKANFEERVRERVKSLRGPSL
jgi:hypothetical protein